MEYASFVQDLGKVNPNGDRCPPESPYSREFERRMGALVLNFDLDGIPPTATAVATENEGLSSEEYDGDSGVGSFDEGKEDRDDHSSSMSGCSGLKPRPMHWTASAGGGEPKPGVPPYGTNSLFSVESSRAENRNNARSNNSDVAPPPKRTHDRCNEREEDTNSKDAWMAKLRKRSSSPTTTISTECFKLSQLSDSQ